MSIPDRDIMPPPTINPIRVAKQYTTRQRLDALKRYREICQQGDIDAYDTRLEKELSELGKILRRPIDMFSRDIAIMSSVMNHQNHHTPPDQTRINRELEELNKREKELREELRGVQRRRVILQKEGQAYKETDWRHRQTITDNPILFQDPEQWVKNYERELNQSD